MWVPEFEQEGAGVGGAGRATQSVRGNCKSFKEGGNLTVVEGMHQFVMYMCSKSYNQ